MEHDHAYLHEHGIAHTHEHNHEHNHEHDHTHPHVHENTKAVLNRLSRAIGHLQSVRKMVEDRRDCSEVLIQIAAGRSAINNGCKVILQDHIQHCKMCIRDSMGTPPVSHIPPTGFSDI